MGRRIRKMTFAEASATNARRCVVRGVTCSRCPKWSRSWCPIFAGNRIPSHPACGYGKVLINAAKVAAKRDCGQGQNPSA